MSEIFKARTAGAIYSMFQTHVLVGVLAGIVLMSGVWGQTIAQAEQPGGAVAQAAQVTCSQCGAVARSGAEFCVQCGASLTEAKRGTRAAAQGKGAGLLPEDEHTYLHLLFSDPEKVQKAGGSMRGRGKFFPTEIGNGYQATEASGCLIYPDKPGFPCKEGTLEVIVSNVGIAVPSVADPFIIHFFQEDNRQVMLRTNSGRLQFIVYASGGSWIVANEPLPGWDLKTPHHLAVTWKGTQAKAYVDGKEQQVTSRGASGEIAPIPLSGGPSLYVGNDSNGKAPGNFAVLELRVSRVTRYEKPEDFKEVELSK